MSKCVYLSNEQLQKLADHANDFLREATITPDLICKFVPWDLASCKDLKAVASVIMDWRPDAQLALGLTPRGGQQQKQQNTGKSPSHPAGSSPSRAVQPITQLSFSPAQATRGRPAHGRGQGRSAGPGNTQQSKPGIALLVSILIVGIIEPISPKWVLVHTVKIRSIDQQVIIVEFTFTFTFRSTHRWRINWPIRSEDMELSIH
ncbi:hypothetical protein B0H17DRAFT_1197075 [Mycena rosella]|uniref:Uncharacterized protein n=1 Tax=Mycena rosella TaxID=1033263 RepID=A0AAD7DSM4_MYCRO|nr:hypothetical protein B0H17DRAFT_1197075 [Mycena rosella]